MNKQLIAKENEVYDVINLIRKGNPVDSYVKIAKIASQAHLYLNQWKHLHIDIDCLKQIIGIIRRYEANGLQLDGKGLWLLSMILEYACANVTVDDATLIVLFDTLLRIAVEHVTHSLCTSILLLLIKNFNAKITKIFETGNIIEFIV